MTTTERFAEDAWAVLARSVEDDVPEPRTVNPFAPGGDVAVAAVLAAHGPLVPLRIGRYVGSAWYELPAVAMRHRRPVRELVRLIVLIHGLGERKSFPAWEFLPMLSSGHSTLLEIRDALAELTGDADERVIAAFAAGSWPEEWPEHSVLKEMPPEAARGFVLANLGRFTAAARNGLLWGLRGLLCAGPLPADALEVCLDHGVGPRVRLRPLARAAAGDAEETFHGVVVRLGARSAPARLQAANWLSELAEHSSPDSRRGAEIALDAALLRERSEAARDAMRGALVALGAPQTDLTDAESLLSEARRTVARGIPALVDWLPWYRLPAVRRAGSGDPVPVEVIQHLVAAAARTRSVVPDPGLRARVGTWEAEDRHGLAVSLLTAWIAQDLLPNSEEEAQAAARAWAENAVDDEGKPVAVLPEGPADETIDWFRRAPRGSAITSKGLLAVVAACGGPGLLAPARRYIHDWYGIRAAQSKALVTMLAHGDDPDGHAHVLALSRGFRTPGIRDLARQESENIARRRGWTTAELGDRLVPTLGVDAQGGIDLLVGGRRFRAVMRNGAELEILSPEGRVVKSLPSAVPGGHDEADSAARAELSRLRKDLRRWRGEQRRRLEEAMVSRRSWTSAELRELVREHPLLSAFLDGVLVDDGTRVLSLRRADEPLLVAGPTGPPPGSRWRLTHAADLDPALRAALEDVGAGVLDQIPVPMFTLPSELRAERELRDLRGHVVTRTDFRRIMTDRSWTADPPLVEDASLTHRRVFAECGHAAVLTHSGYAPSKKQQALALLALHVEENSTGRVLELAEVPPVLLATAHGDLTALAATGPGFDADHERLDLLRP